MLWFLSCIALNDYWIGGMKKNFTYTKMGGRSVLVRLEPNKGQINTLN